MTRRIVILFVLLAIATVPLARGAGSDDPATTSPTPTLGTEPLPSTGAAPTTTAPPVTTPPDAGASHPVPRLIAEGVTVQGIPVGGMTKADAATAVEAAFDQPLRFEFKRRRWWATPSRLGAKAYVAGAIRRAAIARPGADVKLVVTVKGAAVKSYVSYLNRNFTRKPEDSTIRLLHLRPKISKANDGFRVKGKAMTRSIVKALRSGERGPVELEGKVVEPQTTLATFGSVIVIHRGSNQLYLYKGQRFWRKFGVATGQSAYPTPLGHYDIVLMERNPWWYPPQSSAWAKGEKPVPPGPGNPLGTRWMGLSAPLVGIHGTPDAASIGYSASHGCVRMHIPDAEWLFDHVDVGTQVFIVPE